jgi:hypothetical protein
VPAASSSPSPPAPDPSRDRRAPGRGFVNIATPGGWADVFVSGQHRGRTPLQVEVAAGHRTFVLRPFGGKPIRRNVLVRRAQVTRLVVPVHR